MQLKRKTTYNSKQPTLVQVTDKEPKRRDLEVLETKPRHRFTTRYQLSILTEVDASTKLGCIGTLLKREGLYYSNIRTWKRQVQEGALEWLSPKKRGRKKHVVYLLAKRVPASGTVRRSSTGAAFSSADAPATGTIV